MIQIFHFPTHKILEVNPYDKLMAFKYDGSIRAVMFKDVKIIPKEKFENKDHKLYSLNDIYTVFEEYDKLLTNSQIPSYEGRLRLFQKILEG